MNVYQMKFAYECREAVRDAVDKAASDCSADGFKLYAEGVKDGATAMLNAVVFEDMGLYDDGDVLDGWAEARFA